MKNDQSTQSTHQFFYILGFLVILLGIVNIFQIQGSQLALTEKVLEAKEAARPADLSLITLTPSVCPSCASAAEVIAAVKGGNTNILNEQSVDASSPEGAQLISRYGITKVPSVILLGETSRYLTQQFTQRGDGLVYESSIPPYVETATNAVKGMVDVTIINASSCAGCINFELLIPQLKSSGIFISRSTTYDQESKEGKSIISTYGITKVPAVLFSSDIEAYGNEIGQQLLAAGKKGADGTYILEQQTPPFVNLTTCKTVGEVTLYIISDKSCPSCYNAEAVNLPILARLGASPSNIERMDVSDKKALDIIGKYKIQKVPTILLTGDTSAYPILTKVWPEVGTIEPDGAYVFRNVQLLKQTYKDLVTGTIVAPPPPAVSQGAASSSP